MPQTSQAAQSQKATMENGRGRLQQAQEEVEEVRVIMLDNLNKASEREGKLQELESRADQLEQQSKVFSKTAAQVKNKKKWENQKWKIIIAVIIVITVLLIVIIPVALRLTSS